MTQVEVVVLDTLFFIILPAAIGSVLSRWLGDLAKRHGRSPLRVRTLRMVITIAWIAIVIAGTAATLGSFSFLSALTVSAIAAIAVTLALQTTLQNILSGFILTYQRLLRLGDVIQVGGVKGTVVGIGFVAVVLRTENGALAVVSTSNLLLGPMVNFTAPTRLSGEY